MTSTASDPFTASTGRWRVLAAVGVAVAFAIVFGAVVRAGGVGELFATLAGQVDRHPVAILVAYVAVYLLVATLSIPGATALTFLAGALFGVVLGSAVVSVVSTLGATLSFLLSRAILRDWVVSRFAAQAAWIDRRVAEDGVWFLVALRLFPGVPFFLINLAFGLTRLRVAAFALASQLGMLPATVIYVASGDELARLSGGSPLNTRTGLALGSLAVLVVASRLMVRRLRLNVEGEGG